MKSIIFLCIAVFSYNVNCAPLEPVHDEIRTELLNTNPDITIQNAILVFETTENGNVANTVNYILSVLLRDTTAQFPFGPQGQFSIGGISSGGFSTGTVASILG